MRSLIVSLIVALAATEAAAEGTAPKHLKIPSLSDGSSGYITLVNNAALNGSPTFSITKKVVDGMAKAVLTVKRTRSAGTDLTMTCTQSPDGGTTKGSIMVCEYAAGTGVCTHYTNTWKSATSSTETLTWEMSILGYGQIDCTFASTSSTSSDKLTVYGVLATQ